MINRLIIVINKIDTIDKDKRAENLDKKIQGLKKVFSKTKFKDNLDFFCVSAT